MSLQVPGVVEAIEAALGPSKMYVLPDITAAEIRVHLRTGQTLRLYQLNDLAVLFHTHDVRVITGGDAGETPLPTLVLITGWRL